MQLPKPSKTLLALYNLVGGLGIYSLLTDASKSVKYKINVTDRLILEFLCLHSALFLIALHLLNFIAPLLI